MTKILNDSASYVSDSLDGLCAAYPAFVRTGNDGRVIARATAKSQGKVGIASGGGFGHLPLFCGYVGEGLLDACAVGNVFEGPTLGSCQDAITKANRGAGVLLLFGNYGGDRMNFELAADFAVADGVETRTVLGTDDIASAPPDQMEKRRGVAGLILAYKCAGAAAEAGLPLGKVERIARMAVDRTRTIGFATRGCTMPGAAASSFEIADGMVAFGLGIHGEPGLWTRPMQRAEDLAAEACDRLIAEVPAGAAGEVVLMVNSLGATPLEELLILFPAVKRRLEAAGLHVSRKMVGALATSMDMAGASVSLLHLDQELQGYFDAPAFCPFWSV
jgi:phosphoenolpyruvate---glycerone phosphotransferase subunit DhaK